MKMRLKSTFLFIGASFILFTGCKKHDDPGSPCDQPPVGENNADMQNAFETE